MSQLGHAKLLMYGRTLGAERSLDLRDELVKCQSDNEMFVSVAMTEWDKDLMVLRLCSGREHRGNRLSISAAADTVGPLDCEM